MPTKQGILSLCANLDVAYSCEKESFALAEAIDISNCMQDYLLTAQEIPPHELEILTKEAPRAATKSKEVKDVALVLDDQSKTARIGTNLSDK
jgi:hypothetical protein